MVKWLISLVALATMAWATPIDFASFFEPTTLFEERQLASDVRLNEDVMPIHYDIHLTPYFDNAGEKSFTFDGRVEILVRTTRANVVQIVMHANQLTIANDWVVYEENNPSTAIPHPPYTYDQATNKLTLNLNRALRQDINYKVVINFVGILSDAMTGFYRSYYMENGVRKWLGTTQFQSFGARRAFPCFDEPKFKATFKLSMDRLTSYKPTLSNTKIEASSPSTISGRTVDVFKKTPVMSSYLIAFIVSEFEGRQDTLQTNGLYARPQAYDQTEYSHKFLELVLKDFDSYTDYAFLAVPELEKLDQAAIPDFSAGAMENWGLMTYRDVNLLYHPAHSSSANKQRVATVVAHETAHQWFGDLVTCDYWNFVWLNEGFATYFEYFGTHWVEDQWELDRQFVVASLQLGLQDDSLETTRAMSTEGAPTRVTYNKAGSVLRMMEHLVGSNNYKLALQDYFKTHEFSSVVPEHLWTAMQARAASIQVARIMDPWTTQPGYPYITVTVDGAAVSVTQKRFLQKHKDHTDTSTWPIPLTYATKESEFANTSPQQIYYKEDRGAKTFTLPNAPESYFIMNNQQTGFYRVNYDVQNWMKIKDALNTADHGGIHVVNRAQLVDDLFNFARTGIVEYGTALSILEYIKSEESYIPWLPAFNALNYLNQRMFTAEDQERLAFHVTDILSELYETLGYEPKTSDTHTEKLLRAQMLTWLCRYGHEECLEKTRDEFTKFIAAPDTYLVNPDHRSLVYCQGLREGTQNEFNIMWNKYRSANVGHEEITILASLGCTKVPNALRAFLSNMITTEVRNQDKTSALNSALNGNPENIDIVYDYVTQNMAAWTSGFGSVSSALSTIAGRFRSPEQVTKLQTFLLSNQLTLGDSGVNQVNNAITNLEWEWNWAATNGPAIREYLDDKKNSAPVVSVSIMLALMSSIAVMFLH